MAKGNECKRCGKCCKAIPCGIGLALVGDHRPCLALEQRADGKYQCGLVVHASHYVDLGENSEWKDKFLKKLFSHMLGISFGCCSSLRSDLEFQDFLEKHKNKKPEIVFA